MDLRKIRNIGIALTVSMLGLLVNPNIITAKTNDTTDVIYEIQQLTFSDKKDDFSGNDEEEYSDGADYDGDYLNGKRDGAGRYTFDNGDYYEGQWENDLMSGEGVYHFFDGATLTGTFKKCKLRDGIFCYTDENGEYEIEVKEYKYSEEITATFLNGDIYKGNYEDDVFSGKCKILYNSGDQYEGEVEKNDKSGNGTYTWINGAFYIGEWKDDMMNGLGVYHYSSGSYPRLEGEFVNNQPEGECKYYTGENASITTTWKNGECVGQG